MRRSLHLVQIDLDAVPGWGHQPEDHTEFLRADLQARMPHYHPKVTRVPQVSYLVVDDFSGRLIALERSFLAAAREARRYVGPVDFDMWYGLAMGIVAKGRRPHGTKYRAATILTVPWNEGPR